MADTDRQPLMSREDTEGYNGDTHEETVEAEKNASELGLYVWLLTLSAGISGLLFGCVISATLVSIGSSLGHPLTTLDKSLITSATALFALLVSPISGILADALGRKRVILLADTAFIVGAGLQAFTTSVFGMIIGRSIVGIAVGTGSFVAPLYIAELAPATFRGRLMTFNVLFITLGQVIAYIVGWIFVELGSRETGWRWIVGLGSLPAVVQALVMISMPETPRWLVMKDRQKEAERVLTKVFGSGPDVQKTVKHILRGIDKEVREEQQAKIGRDRTQDEEDSHYWLAGTNWGELFRVGANRRALTIACLLQGLQQLSGFNSLMYFSATIFTLLEFSSPTLTSLSVAVTNFIMTCIAILIIDRVGKRRILLWSVPVMVIGLLACSIGFSFVTLPSNPGLINRSSTRDTDVSVPRSKRLAPAFILVNVMLYVASYAIGLGNVPWMQSELFPLNVRSIGSGISTSCNWGANFVVGLTFLPMMEFLTPTWTFVIYAIVCFLGWLCIWRIYPETNGLSLEEMGLLLANGWGVKESLRRRDNVS
ncbi:general substrate transporter [Xylogone sp. PMI_703]|nr:general substrate transporter [Xylogone sp. PMI_703]